ncbi:MAG: signal recognition particle protein [Planctomycetota bacterium]|jgi:signal recognition particle subunit SRP54
MFESITETLTGIFGKWRGKGRLSEKNIRDGLREVRLALLEADVNFKVVKDFIRRVTEKAIGDEVIQSVTPAQQIVKVVQDELTDLMGPSDPNIPFNPRGPTVIMLAGLQGSGKTTTSAKLAHLLVRKGRNPMLVAADIQRPGAVDQLKILGEEVGVPVFADEKLTPPKICQRAVKEARKTGRDTVILDTAGRLHIDEPLMRELRDIVKRTKPHQTFLVADAMTGQDAVNSAGEFDRQLPLDGVILTKLDGDARGGAALSVKAVTGKPVKFVGVSERIEGLEEFHPDRMAQRILGMGDIVTLVEKAKEVIDEDQAEEMRQKLMEASFTLDDFLVQMEQVEKMGSVKDLMAMIPGLGQQFGQMEVEDSEIARVKAIIQSMTPREKEAPDIIEASRRYRIARGSGTTTSDVNELIKQFKAMKKMMSNLTEGGGLMGRVAGFQMKRAKRKRMKDQQKKKKRKKKR